MLEPDVDTLTSNELETMETLDEPNFSKYSFKYPIYSVNIIFCKDLSLFESKPTMNGFKKTTMDNYLSQTRQVSGDWQLIGEIYSKI